MELVAHRKRRVFQHVMESDSISLIKEFLPSEWVIREYSPDYGIDLVVEVFECVDAKRKIYEALGEMFLSQVKSVSKTVISSVEVYSRMNVEKYGYLELKDEKSIIDVLKFTIDTDELLTIQSMGAGLPVLLILVCLDTNRIFYICLNDLIDKVILPTDPNVYNKKSKTIEVPIWNEITKDENSIKPLRFYAKRMKLYSAFTKFYYQKNELYRMAGLTVKSNIKRYANTQVYLKQTIYFIEILKRLDVWSAEELWGGFYKVYDNLIKLEAEIIGILERLEKLIEQNRIGEIPKQIPGFEYSPPFITIEITNFWDYLSNLSNIYEEICREWNLPTYLANGLR